MSLTERVPSWRANGEFQVGPGGAEWLELRTPGNLYVRGTFVSSSDVNAKENLVVVDPQEVLAKLALMANHEWSFNGEAVRHLGPTAQDFHAAFGLGSDEVTIAPLDVAGVALSSVQALHQIIDEKDATIADLERRLERLEALLAGQ